MNDAAQLPLRSDIKEHSKEHHLKNNRERYRKVAIVSIDISYFMINEVKIDCFMHLNRYIILQEFVSQDWHYSKRASIENQIDDPLCQNSVFNLFSIILVQI